MSKPTTATRYMVTLEAPSIPGDEDGIRRLRRWLKQSWRGYALKCVDIGLAATANPATLLRSEATDVSG